MPTGQCQFPLYPPSPLQEVQSLPTEPLSILLRMTPLHATKLSCRASCHGGLHSATELPCAVTLLPEPPHHYQQPWDPAAQVPTHSLSWSRLVTEATWFCAKEGGSLLAFLTELSGQSLLHLVGLVFIDASHCATCFQSDNDGKVVLEGSSSQGFPWGSTQS